MERFVHAKHGDSTSSPPWVLNNGNVWGAIGEYYPKEITSKKGSITNMIHTPLGVEDVIKVFLLGLVFDYAYRG